MDENATKGKFAFFNVLNAGKEIKYHVIFKRIVSIFISVDKHSNKSDINVKTS